MFVNLPNALGDAATNMAIDAALLETLPEGLVVFRHYGWIEPALTFGYSQSHREVAEVATEGITLCRRMTGGGIVDHRNDWTYALVIQKGAKSAQVTSTELYETIHQSLSTALAEQAIETRLASCPRGCDASPKKSASPDQCFTQPVMNDVLRPDGAKIAGAAMKRTRKGLLIQGSINRAALPRNWDERRFTLNVTRILSTALQLEVAQSADLRSLLDSSLIEKEKVRFASEAWTKRR